MPISFANPALLLGALTAVLPIVIHFLSRRATRRVEFSDLRFLDKAQIQQTRSLGIRRWLLLLLRVLALLCVALAIARPQWGGVAPIAGGERSILFLIDVSASMQTQQDNGTRLSHAREICAGMIRSLPQGSSIQIVSMGSIAQTVFADWLPAASIREPELAGLEVTDGNCNLAAGMRVAADQIQTAPTAPVEIVLLSDLQGNLLGADSQEVLAAGRRLMSAGKPRLLIRQIGETTENGGVLAVRLPQRAVRTGESIVIGAVVLLEHDNDSFQLELDGQRVAESTVSGSAGTTVEIVFSLTVPEPGLHRGRVLKKSDKLPSDDSRPFVLQVRDQISVLLVHGADRDAISRGDRNRSSLATSVSESEVSGRGGWRYFYTALAPGGGQTLFSVRDVLSSELAAGDLNQVDVVLFVDPDPLGRQLLGGVLDWLTQGGSAAFLLGDPTLAGYLEQTLLPSLGLSPQVTFRSRDHTEQEKATIIAPEHPIFAGLDADALATLGEIDWRRYFVLEEGDAQVLMTLTSQAPALLENYHGRGTSLLLPYNLHLNASNLAVSPMSLPFCQRLTSYLAGRSTGAGAVQIDVGGRPAINLGPDHVAATELVDAADLRVSAIDLGILAEPALLSWPGGVPQLLGATTSRAGFYNFLVGADTVGVVAAVTPAGESTPQLGTVDRLQADLAAVGLTNSGDLSTVAVAEFSDILAGRELSPWLFALAMVLLALELSLGRGGRRN